MLGIPETRSTWLWECLRSEIIQDIDVFSELFNVTSRAYTHFGDTKREEWPPHIDNIEISKSCILPRKTYEKIAIVRDPWERYIGIYEHLKRMPTHQMHHAVQNWDFNTFIINLSQGNCTFDIVPQINWLFNKHGQIDTDIIFKFHETTEIKSFFVKRGYVFDDIELNSKQKDIEKYYTPQLAKIVASMCWFETKFFGFKNPFDK